MIFPDLPHLRQLQRDLRRWPTSRVALMVGAGFSLNAEPLTGATKNFPIWRDLAQRSPAVKGISDSGPPLRAATAAD